MTEKSCIMYVCMLVVGIILKKKCDRKSTQFIITFHAETTLRSRHKSIIFMILFMIFYIVDDINTNYDDDYYDDDEKKFHLQLKTIIYTYVP